MMMLVVWCSGRGSKNYVFRFSSTRGLSHANECGSEVLKCVRVGRDIPQDAIEFLRNQHQVRRGQRGIEQAKKLTWILNLLRYIVAGGIVELAVPDGTLSEMDWAQLTTRSPCKWSSCRIRS
jgi:hypothetical protein